MWESISPGVTNLPLKSTISVAGERYSFGTSPLPTATILSFSITIYPLFSITSILSIFLLLSSSLDVTNCPILYKTKSACIIPPFIVY